MSHSGGSVTTTTTSGRQRLATVDVRELNTLRWGPLRQIMPKFVEEIELARVGAADLQDHLKFEISYAPQAWAALYNLTKGAAFGLSHNVFQAGYLWPRNRHGCYRNLYFVGASTHPGGGLPVVLESARLATERIQSNLRLVAAPGAQTRHRPLSRLAVAPTRAGVT